MKKLRKILTFIGNSTIVAIIVIILFMLLACVPQTADQIADREYRNDITREMYYACKGAWSRAGIIWYENRHTGSGRIKMEPHPMDMRFAMAANQCRPYLRKLGY